MKCQGLLRLKFIRLLYSGGEWGTFSFSCVSTHLNFFWTSLTLYSSEARYIPFYNIRQHTHDPTLRIFDQGVRFCTHCARLYGSKKPKWLKLKLIQNLQEHWRVTWPHTLTLYEWQDVRILNFPWKSKISYDKGEKEGQCSYLRFTAVRSILHDTTTFFIWVMTAPTCKQSNLTPHLPLDKKYTQAKKEFHLNSIPQK